MIKERKIKKKFVCFVRADFIVKHPEIIKKLSEIGFYYILTGLEYIENKRLSDTNKRSGVNTNGRAIKILHDNGIYMMGMFITDLDFRKKDFKNLYRWIKHFKLKHAAVSIYTPEMCLENFEEYRDKYAHPLWQAYRKEGVKEGHGGVDWLVLNAFIDAVKVGGKPPIDVYDTALWGAVTALSEQSIAMGGATLPVPDFTKGRWISREPVRRSRYCLDEICDECFE